MSQKAPVPNVEELISSLSSDNKKQPQPPVKLPPPKSQLSNAVPSETFCSTSVTPRQRPKPLNSTITSAPLGSSPVLKRALFPNAASIQQAVSQSPDVAAAFAAPANATECTDTRFQPTDHTQPPSETTSYENLFPSNTGKKATLDYVFFANRVN